MKNVDIYGNETTTFQTTIEHIQDHLPLYVASIFLASIVALLTGAIIQDTKKEARLMKQCLEDGHKEYQCEGFLRKGESSTVFIPVRLK